MGADSFAWDACAVIPSTEIVEDGVDTAAGAGNAEGLGVGGSVEVEVDGGQVVEAWGLLKIIGYGSWGQIY